MRNRKELEKFLLTKQKFIATFGNVGPRGRYLVFIHIFHAETGEYLTDHIWFEKNYFCGFELTRGDIFQFEGDVTEYLKGRSFEQDAHIRDFKISNLVEIQKVYSTVEFLKLRRTLIKLGKLKPLETIRGVCPATNDK